MNTCKNCQKERENQSDKNCIHCGFPHFGDEKERASFYARETILESEIQTAKKSILFSQIALILATILAAIPLFSISNTDSSVLFIIQSTIVLLFAACSILSFFKPILASVIGFSILLLLYLSQLSNIELFWSGFISKVASLAFLGVGVFKILNVKKQMKRHPEMSKNLNIKL